MFGGFGLLIVGLFVAQIAFGIALAPAAWLVWPVRVDPWMAEVPRGLVADPAAHRLTCQPR
jgi:hypothetical protein